MKSCQGVRLYQNTNCGEGTVRSVIAIFDENRIVKQYPNLTTNHLVVLGIQTEAWEETLVSFYL